MIATATRVTQFVRCDVGPRSVGLSMRGVDGVERADRVRPAPHRPELFGVLPTRGGERPVYRLADHLGMPSRGASGQVVLLTTAAGAFGLLVDRVSPVIRVPEEAVYPCPVGFGPRERALYSGVVLHDGEPVLMVSPDAVLNAAGASSGHHGELRFPPGSDRLLVFDVTPDPQQGGRPVGFGVPAGWVVEIADVGEFTPLPAATHLRGVMSWRNRPAGVIDLAAWVGLRPAAEGVSRVVGVRTSRGVVAFVTGTGVKLVGKGTPHIVSRRAWQLNDARVLGVLDFDDVSVVLPQWALVA
jgi:purine-binding chemotaxis protein CheW